MRLSSISLSAVVVAGLAGSAGTARAECNCVAIAGDVVGAFQADVAKADTLFARGDFNGALALYAKVYGGSKDGVLLYAQGMAYVQLGIRDKAKAMFQAYLAAGGTLAYRNRAEAQMSLLGGVAAAVDRTGGALGGIGGDVGRVGGGVVGGGVGVVGGVGGGAVGGVRTGVDAGAGAVGGLKSNVDGKVKVGRTAGIALGVIAVAALGAVLIHTIAAGVSDDIEIDPKFDLGMGIAGVSVGISAIYVGGLTAATGAAAGAPCLGMPATNNAKPVGLAAGFRF